MTYDAWKTRSPDDENPYGDEPPEVFEECPDCNGEGAIEVWESGSRWSIDPPSVHAVPCKTCDGAGGMICEAKADPEGFASYDATECPF
jgi:DnaJ-class molecular chaperone